MKELDENDKFDIDAIVSYEVLRAFTIQKAETEKNLHFSAMFGQFHINAITIGQKYAKDLTLKMMKISDHVIIRHSLV